MLIVSRTYLPLNFFGSRPGGYPDYPHSFSNQQIIGWLASQLADLQSGMQGGKRPRDLIGLKTWIKSWDQRQIVNDHVWSREFWHHPVLDCPQCRTIGQACNRYVVDDLLFTRGPNFTRFTPDQIDRSLQTGKITCGNPNCRAEYTIEKSSPHYLWIAPGRAEEIARFIEYRWVALNSFLVAMPTYLIKN